MFQGGIIHAVEFDITGNSGIITAVSFQINATFHVDGFVISARANMNLTSIK